MANIEHKLRSSEGSDESASCCGSPHIFRLTFSKARKTTKPMKRKEKNTTEK